MTAALDSNSQELKALLDGMSALKAGDFSFRLPREWPGLSGKVADAFNDLIEMKQAVSNELERVCREVGKEGKIQQRANTRDFRGSWLGMVNSMNTMVEELVRPTTEMSRVVGAVAKGDLSQTVELETGGRPLEGEFLKAARTVNTMVSVLGSFTSEVTRVAREVGTEGKLGGQAVVPGVSGSWKDLTDSLNFMSYNLSGQIRNIADVTTAVANGDLSTKVTAEVRGEFLLLKDKVNTMVDQLRFFTSEVTRVAREVGVEGKLGGQAIAPGAAGTWKELTDNVNQLAANLTTQVRAISEVASSVTQGDLTRSISMDARGEVETLKDTVNQMIANLRVTTQKDADQVWLKTNLARFTLMLQGQSDLQTVADVILTELSKVVGAQHGVFYIADLREDKETRLKMLSAFAYQPRQDLAREFALGEGLVGQCARDKVRILVNDPPLGYIRISSGLGEKEPANIVVLPILFEKQMKAVIELASFDRFSPTHLDFLEQLMEGIGIVLNTLEANLHTETLLKSLQTQQEELRKTNQALEEKADQLALTSKYKSEFLSNMSHELRTPLNSMMILSQQLAEDSKNLSGKQVEYAKTIHSSGGDLLSLINDILDLSKVESGTLVLELEDLPFTEIQQHLERIFRHLAENKGLHFSFDIDFSKLDHVHTDGKRLEQILRNLLSNAFKFTEKGQVSLKVETVSSGWTADHPVLSKAEAVVAFTVTDSGIGIPAEKQRIIFEAFQQADSGTSRKYGGTGLGLSISRELAKLLGCQLTLANSAKGKGSTFVLYVPSEFAPQISLTAVASPILFSDARTYVQPDKPAEVVLKVLEPVADDRKNIQPGDVVVLIVEDNRTFAGVILETVRERGFKGLVAHDGRSAVKLAAEIKPDAVTLDIRLPDIDGWGVLARFKSDPATRHIPIQIISVDEDRSRGLKQGALAVLAKPVAREDLNKALDALRLFRARPLKNLLVLCPDKDRGNLLTELLDGNDVKLSLVASGKAALAALQDQHFDCVVMEIPEKESQVVLQAVGKDPSWANLPIVVIHLKGDLSAEEELLMKSAAQATVVKEVKSMERLLDETALYLHRALDGMPPDKKILIENLYRKATALAEKKALVVDDDFRNIFAMTSLLENNHMTVMSAESGAGAIQILDEHPDIDVVLMDIMMPDMDGYDTMQMIRKDARFKALPIIALTAKAMKGDREKCIESGASDYITKPVDSQQLLGLMRLWLHR
jgi:signal transduction histidine kinase/DNA-binding response OmpR family regulator/HAMP domain-containing protein